MEAMEGFRAEEGQSQTQLLPAPGLGGVKTGQRRGPRAGGRVQSQPGVGRSAATA